LGKSEDSGQLSPFERRRLALERLDKYKTLLFTLIEGHCQHVSIDDMGHSANSWRLIGRTNSQHVEVEVDGDYDGNERLGEIAFEVNTLQPEKIFALISLRPDHFQTLWLQFLADRSCIWNLQLKFSGAVLEDHGRPNWLPVKGLEVWKVITRTG
jgi:hypothetical protein